MKKQFWKIKRRNRATGKEMYLSQRFKRWLPFNSIHRHCKVTEEKADELLEVFNMRAGSEVFFYFKVMI